VKRTFFTGLAILLPLVLTLIVIKICLMLLTKPFLGLTLQIMHSLPFIQESKFLNRPEVILFVSQVLSLIFFVALLTLIGWLTKMYLFNQLIQITENILLKVPLVNKVYHASKEVIRNIFRDKSNSFREVVLVPYPNTTTLALGLVTQQTTVSNGPSQKGDEELISVFIPGTPNPTIGFIILFREDEIVRTDMTIRRAVQTIISCGAKMENFNLKVSGTPEVMLEKGK